MKKYNQLSRKQRYAIYLGLQAKMTKTAMMRRQRSVSNRKTPLHVLNEAKRLLIEEDWSPKQISGKLALEGINISHERIYQEIRNDSTGELKKHCRHKMKYRHHTNQKRNTAGKSLIPDIVSIHE